MEPLLFNNFALGNHNNKILYTIMTEDQLKFFNLNEPCPDDIINCDSVREQYKKEYQDLTARGACGGCLERSLRNKYIVLLSALVKK